MDDNLLYAAADAFRRLAEAPGTSPAERKHWSGLIEQARRLIEKQEAQGNAEFATVNEDGYIVGSRHHRAKLSDADVDLIHELAAAGRSHAQIAATFDDGVCVSRSMVGHILSGRRRSQTTRGHRLVAARGEPTCWPASVDEFDVVMH